MLVPSDCACGADVILGRCELALIVDCYLNDGVHCVVLWAFQLLGLFNVNLRAFS